MGTRDKASRSSSPEPSRQGSGSSRRFQSAATNALYPGRDRLPRPPGAFHSPSPSVASSRPPTYRTIETQHANYVPRVYPGAYPPSPSQASAVSRRTVDSQRSSVGTPAPIGAYPPSCQRIEAPSTAPSEATNNQVIPGGPGACPLAPREVTSSATGTSTPMPIGAYPPSSGYSETGRRTASTRDGTSNTPNFGAYPEPCVGSSTVSSETTIYTAPEYPEPRTATPLQGPVVEYSTRSKEMHAKAFFGKTKMGTLNLMRL
jgi:hypothetical protein